MGIKEIVKSLLAQENKTMSSLAKGIGQRSGHETTVQNLSGKLSKETLRYREAEEIADILGYEIRWEKIKKKED